MPNRPTETFQKVTLNLFQADIEAFRARYGFGWSEQIRNLVHENVKEWGRAKRVIDLVFEDGEEQ